LEILERHPAARLKVYAAWTDTVIGSSDELAGAIAPLLATASR
jgi:hypothetical protein